MLVACTCVIYNVSCLLADLATLNKIFSSLLKVRHGISLDNVFIPKYA